MSGEGRLQRHGVEEVGEQRQPWPSALFGLCRHVAQGLRESCLSEARLTRVRSTPGWGLLVRGSVPVCHTAVASELASLASCSPSSTPPFSASETWLGLGLGFGFGLGLGLGPGQG